MENHDRNAGIGAAAILVGGGLLLWLLLRNKWGVGGVGDGAGGTDERGVGAGASSALSAEPLWCNVRVDSNGISLDGELVDAPTVVARCGAARGAFLRVTGGAKHGDFKDVVEALRLAGLEVHVTQQLTEDRSESRIYLPLKPGEREQEFAAFGFQRYLI